MEYHLEKVTPKKAEAWLDTNYTNRKLREGVAEKYAADMVAGRWTQCPVPISFYADGALADGQHRLFAVVHSETTQNFIVVRGLSREDGLNIDTGLSRSLVDAGRISGVDKDLSHTLISVARAVEMGEPSKGALSNAQRLEMVEKHRDAAKWAISSGPKAKYLNNAVVHAAVARAWYVEADEDRLRRFCDVLGTGFSQGDGETAAQCMRTYLLTKGPVCSSAAMWRDTFLKVQNAIAYFMQGKKLTVIKGVADEAYPLKRARAKRKAA